MANRMGEKLGWLGGWLGGFLWVGLLGLVFLFQGKTVGGLAGLALFGVALVIVILSAPWRHPAVRYWKLMLPVYGLLALSVLWAIWAGGGVQSLGLNPWSLLGMLPLLVPFGTVGRLRWDDFRDPAAEKKERG